MHTFENRSEIAIVRANFWREVVVEEASSADGE
jgi:hypothetical protein